VDRRNLKWITWAFVVVTVLAVVLMLNGSLRRTSHITLPLPGENGDTVDVPGMDDGVLTVISVTPDTVQSAVASLRRPESYSRVITVEQYWKGGSGAYKTTVYVSGDWTRTDRTMPDGRVRHTVTGPETVYIWYDDETEVFTAPVGDISADQAQTIPTYEEILDLPKSDLFMADFRTVSQIDCIYVETVPDEAGYVMRYWVSVDTGLLTVAEKALDGEPVYRMASLSAEETDTRSAFVLPDGTPLI